MDKVKSGKIVLKEKEMILQNMDGSWPVELQNELEDEFNLDAVKEDILQNDIDFDTLFDSSREDWIKEFQQMSKPPDYLHQEKNAFQYHADPFSEGLRLLEVGNLTEAILCFEAAVQNDATHTLAWQFLGTSQAENENDPAAIAALRRCLQLQPDSQVALMAIATSFTNEGNHLEALQALKNWLQSDQKYGKVINWSELSAPQSSESEHSWMFFVDPELLRQVQHAFELVSQINIDADVHIGLGVMHHMVHNYDEAVANFQIALSQKPTDARLWNKLGATLANGNRNEEAMLAYNRALDLNPGFVRAQYNVGIAFTNLGRHHDAATHFLRALSMQQANVPRHVRSSVRSDEIWDVARSTFTLMNRPDLVEKAKNQDILLFRDEFDLLV